MATHQQITKAIYRLREKWNHKGFSARAINTGNCDSFAQELEKKFCIKKHVIIEDGLAIWGDDYPELFTNGVDNEGHCFFSFKGRYYDSECPLGVSSPENLPFYLRQKSFHDHVLCA